MLRKALFALLMAVGPAGLSLLAAEPPAIPVDQFDKLHKLIERQPGESPWAQVPWLTSVWEARKQAAAAGKPILVWSAGGSAPLGVC